MRLNNFRINKIIK